MPVTRYRSVEDMPDPPLSASAIEGLSAACAASVISRRFGYLARAPRGVHKFRSVADADAERQRWEATRIADLHTVGPQTEDHPRRDAPSSG